MKRLLVCIMSAALAIAAGACGTDTEESYVSETDENDTDEAEDIEESADEEETPETSHAADPADLPDVSGAVKGDETSIEDPAPLGTWVETTIYATKDDTFHTVYVRITGITKQGADADYVVSAINANNDNVVEDEWISVSDLEVPSDGELVVMDYEVYVPEDFPAPSYGMAEPKLYFTVKNVNGTGIPSAYGNGSYTGMNTTYDLSVRDPDETYYPGNVYEEKCLYVMVKGYSDYVITYFSFPDGTMSGEMDTENMYRVYHAVK